MLSVRGLLWEVGKAAEAAGGGGALRGAGACAVGGERRGTSTPPRLCRLGLPRALCVKLELVALAGVPRLRCRSAYALALARCSSRRALTACSRSSASALRLREAEAELDPRSTALLLLRGEPPTMEVVGTRYPMAGAWRRVRAAGEGDGCWLAPRPACHCHSVLRSVGLGVGAPLPAERRSMEDVRAGSPGVKAWWPDCAWRALEGAAERAMSLTSL